ncbi:leucine-rich repeat domain-containing protein [uncultured Cohaesibacter sp.]|uniref:leucine-rich repeat domain-containing protein n=1 Tax=uncultured Cohaesibacter sp. TaxID=1002546 RepID=UPI0029C86351|nr:leucine-rich repeat domain-containing protein [uncultured Cohaesibacter sp.]
MNEEQKAFAEAEEAISIFNENRLNNGALSLKIRNLKKIPNSIKYLININDLDLSGTQITSIDILAHLVNMRRLNLSGTPILSIDCLSQLPTLYSLNLSGTKVSSLDSIAEIESLTALNVSGTRIKTIAPLKNLYRLGALDLSNTHVTEIESMANLNDLTDLDLCDTPIDSIDSLRHLSKLTFLDLSGTQITSVEPLSKLANLQKLRLSNTNVESIAAISNLRNLRRLDLDNSQVDDLRPIKRIRNLIKEGGLSFRDCKATAIDPELNALSQISNARERAINILDYLSQLNVWPPVTTIPKELPGAPRYLVPDNGPIVEIGETIGLDNPEQQALQNECREKVRILIDSVQEGNNELGALVEAAKKYERLVIQDSTGILASALWSAANTLRAKHEAHKNAVIHSRINEELPPNTASALQDLLETHGIYFLGHPGAADVEKKMRDFLLGPRNPEAKEAADKLLASLEKAPTVLAPSATDPMLSDQYASNGIGPSAHMGEILLQQRLRNVFASIARKIWIFVKSKPGVAIDAVIAADIINWFAGNQLWIVKFFEAVTGRYPIWIDQIIELISKIQP